MDAALMWDFGRDLPQGEIWSPDGALWGRCCCLGELLPPPHPGMAVGWGARGLQ